jgi:hypothetical protein
MSKLSYALGMLTLAGAGLAEAAPTTVALNFSSPDYSTYTSNVEVVTLTPITLAGATAPQFYFGTYYSPCMANPSNSFVSGANGSVYGALNFLETAQAVSAGDLPNAAPTTYAGSAYSNSAFGQKNVVPGLPSPGESFSNKPVSLAGFYESPKSYTPAGGGTPVDISNIDALSYRVQDQTGLSGDLYTHTIFEANGQTYIGDFHVHTLGGVASITFAPVPEPDAWALLIAGAGMVGGAARARRRKVALSA